MEQLSEILINDFSWYYAPILQGQSNVEWLRWLQTQLKTPISGAIAP